MFFAIPRHRPNHSISEIFIVLKSFILGKIVNGNMKEEFEKVFNEYIGSKKVFTLSSARGGFNLILNSFNLKKGDEILLSSYNFHAIPNIIVSRGLIPVFVDVNKSSFNMDFKDLESKISKKTKAIIATHLFGLPIDMKKIMNIAKKNKLYVIEDCAHSLGSEIYNKKTGSFADAAIFSFGTGKNIDLFGGGAISVNNQKLIGKIENSLNLEYPKTFEVLKKIFFSFFFWFFTNKIIFTLFIFPVIFLTQSFGYDMAHEALKEDEKIFKKIPKKFIKQMANIQFEIGIKQIKSINDFTKNKRKISEKLNKLFAKNSNVVLPKLIEGAKPAYLLYSILSENKYKIKQNLLKNMIDFRSEYMFICPKLKMFSKFFIKTPNADYLSKNIVHLPNANVSIKDVEKIAKIVNEVK